MLGIFSRFIPETLNLHNILKQVVMDFWYQSETYSTRRMEFITTHEALCVTHEKEFVTPLCIWGFITLLDGFRFLLQLETSAFAQPPLGC